MLPDEVVIVLFKLSFVDQLEQKLLSKHGKIPDHYIHMHLLTSLAVLCRRAWAEDVKAGNSSDICLTSHDFISISIPWITHFHTLACQPNEPGITCIFGHIPIPISTTTSPLPSSTPHSTARGPYPATTPLPFSTPTPQQEVPTQPLPPYPSQPPLHSKGSLPSHYPPTLLNPHSTARGPYPATTPLPFSTPHSTARGPYPATTPLPFSTPTPQQGVPPIPLLTGYASLAPTAQQAGEVQASTSYLSLPPTPPDIYLSRVRGLGNPPPSPTKSSIENVCSIIRESRSLIKKGRYTLVAIKLAHKVVYGTEMMNKVKRMDELPLHLTDFLKSVMR